MEEYKPDDLRLVAVKVSSEAAALLRDSACDPEMLRVVRGDTIKADLVSENYIIEGIRGEGIRARIISEESGVVGDGDVVVLIDPLDGSSNYSSCVSWASVSIAFADKKGNLLAGAVSPVFHGYPISFSRGGGVFYGGVRLNGPLLRDKHELTIAAYFDNINVVNALASIISEVRRRGKVKVRSLGSSALEIAYTSLGFIDLFIDIRGRLRNIDVAASTGIVRELGGLVVDSQGRDIVISVDGIKRVESIISTMDEGLASIVVNKLSGSKYSRG